MSADMRYIAQRYNGSDQVLNGSVLHPELPLTNVTIVEAGSGTNTIEATVDPALKTALAPDGGRILEPWGTIVICEDGNDIIGGLLTDRGFSDSSTSLSFIGMLGYPKDQPYTEAWFGVEVDPLDVEREIWRHLDAQPGSKTGVEIPDLKTGLKIGTKLEQVEFDTQAGPVAFEAGPIKLAWYATTDLGSELDKLADETPYDFRERWWYDQASGLVRVRKEIGYPTLGRQRPERFVLGENVNVIPSLDYDTASYASEVLVIGAGEGNAAVRSTAARVEKTRCRRVAVVTDSSLKSVRAAASRANNELLWRIGADDISEIVVTDSVAAPISSLETLDHILVEGDAGAAGEISVWLRILTKTTTPDDSNVAVLSVVRSDKVEAQ